ncbi:unnamed protein product [Closterium sp. NIES-54]
MPCTPLSSAPHFSLSPSLPSPLVPLLPLLSSTHPTPIPTSLKTPRHLRFLMDKGLSASPLPIRLPRPYPSPSAPHFLLSLPHLPVTPGFSWRNALCSSFPPLVAPSPSKPSTTPCTPLPSAAHLSPSLPSSHLPPSHNTSSFQVPYGKGVAPPPLPLWLPRPHPNPLPRPALPSPRLLPQRLPSLRAPAPARVHSGPARRPLDPNRTSRLSSQGKHSGEFKFVWEGGREEGDRDA